MTYHACYGYTLNWYVEDAWTKNVVAITKVQASEGERNFLIKPAPRCVKWGAVLFLYSHVLEMYQ